MNDMCKRRCTLIGVCLVFFPSGLIIYWGNISVYCKSYQFNRLKIHAGINAPWVIPLNELGTGVGIAVAGLLVKSASRIIIGVCLLANISSILVSYFAVQSSPLSLNICCGIYHGLTRGPLVTILFQLLADWAEEKSGLYLAIARSGMLIGTIFINQLVPLYINPDNLQPDTDIGTTRLFSQSDILDRVPVVFLYMGIMCGTIQITGFFLLRFKDDNPTDTSDHASGLSRQTTEHKTYESTGTKDAPYLDLMRNRRDVENNDASASYLQPGDENEKETQQIGDTLNENIDGPNTLQSSTTTVNENIDHQNTLQPPTITHKNRSSGKDIPTKAMLRTLTFYILFFIYNSVSLTFVVGNAFYKTYGFLWISNDFLLATVGNLNVVGGIVSSIVWGILLDRFDTKVVMIMYTATLALLSFVVYFPPMISAWLYCATMIMFSAMVMPLYTIYSIVVLKVFGKKHFMSNYACFNLGMCPVSLVSASILEGVLLRYGWFGVYVLSGVIPLVSLVAIVMVLKRQPIVETQ